MRISFCLVYGCKIMKVMAIRRYKKTTLICNLESQLKKIILTHVHKEYCHILFITDIQVFKH